MTASARADGDGDTGVTVDRRKLHLGAWWVVGLLVLISGAFLWLSIVTLVRAGSRPIDSYTFAHLPVGSFYGTASGRLSELCPSPLQWVKGYRDNLCGVVLRRQSVLALVYLACGLVVAELAVLASRHHKHLVERSVALREWARATGRHLRDRGTTRKTPRLVEYAPLAILVAVVSLVAISLSGKASSKHFCETYSQLGDPPPGAQVDSCGHWHLP